MASLEAKIVILGSQGRYQTWVDIENIPFTLDLGAGLGIVWPLAVPCPWSGSECNYLRLKSLA